MFKQSLIVLLVFVLAIVFAINACSAKGNAAKGKTIYAYNCALCHGDAGMGNGAAGVACNPMPTDFTDAALMSKKTAEDLFKAITKGVSNTCMPPYEKMLSKQDRQDVVAYIRTLVHKASTDSKDKTIIAPREGVAEKGFGITKTQYISAYNKLLTKFNLRFEKTNSSYDGDTYTLSSYGAILALKPGNTEQMNEIQLLIFNVKGRPESDIDIVMGLGVVTAVEPNPTTNTAKLFTRKFKGKMDQGLKKFSFEMYDKSINVEITAGILLTIKPL